MELHHRAVSLLLATDLLVSRCSWCPGTCRCRYRDQSYEHLLCWAHIPSWHCIWVEEKGREVVTHKAKAYTYIVPANIINRTLFVPVWLSSLQNRWRFQSGSNIIDNPCGINNSIFVLRVYAPCPDNVQRACLRARRVENLAGRPALAAGRSVCAAVQCRFHTDHSLVYNGTWRFSEQTFQVNTCKVQNKGATRMCMNYTNAET